MITRAMVKAMLNTTLNLIRDWVDPDKGDPKIIQAIAKICAIVDKL